LSYYDKTTIWKFRERLGVSGMAGDLFDRVVNTLGESGVILNNGTLVDASIIPLPPGRKRADATHTADPCASKTAKHSLA